MKPSSDSAPLKEVIEMEAWTRDVFQGTRQLNPMQSTVFQTAFHSSENMLVRMKGWRDEGMDGWIDGSMDGWMDGWMDGGMKGWMREGMVYYVYHALHCSVAI